MSLTRQLFLDTAPGETRGVVLVNGRPERLLIARDGDPTPRLGARYLGRVVASSSRMGLARIDIGFGGEPGLAVSLKLSGADAPADGATVEVEVVAEPARGKGAQVSLIRTAPTGRPEMTSAAPNIRDRLLAFAPDAAIVEGDRARDVADDAQAEALAREHVHSGGLTLTIESTCALIAVDVDLSETGAPKSSLQANLTAIRQASRLLRLKALSGLIVIDLIGFPKEKARLQAIAQEAFAQDGPEVVIGPLSRFGALELSRPRRDQPLHERLLAADGRPSARTLSQDAIRQFERQGRFQPGLRLVAVCAPELAPDLRPLVASLGPRFSLREEVGRDRANTDIREA
ncbi:MAG: ribonuclease E/G [Caulobacteraceae bacterium]